MPAMSRILRMVSTGTNQQCKMCKDTNIGKRWEYRADSLIPGFVPEIVLVCEKCAYRENYGAKYYKKAKKQKLLEKLNYNFNGNLPKLEK
jgi:C4-type Zn-finger protein